MGCARGCAQSARRPAREPGEQTQGLGWRPAHAHRAGHYQGVTVHLAEHSDQYADTRVIANRDTTASCSSSSTANGLAHLLGVGQLSSAPPYTRGFHLLGGAHELHERTPGRPNRPTPAERPGSHSGIAVTHRITAPPAGTRRAGSTGCSGCTTRPWGRKRSMTTRTERSGCFPGRASTTSSENRRRVCKASFGPRSSITRSAADFDTPNSGASCRNVELVRQYAATSSTRSSSGTFQGRPRAQA